MSDLDKLTHNLAIADQMLRWAEKRIEELETLTKWQPIETAPHITNPGEGDDEEILIWAPEGGLHGGTYLACYDTDDADGQPLFFTAYGSFRAIHWMPLPPPPAD